MIVYDVMSEKEVAEEVKKDYLNVMQIVQREKFPKFRRLIMKSSRFPISVYSDIVTKRNNRWLVRLEADSKRTEGPWVVYICLCQSARGGLYALRLQLREDNSIHSIQWFAPHFFARYAERMEIDLTGVALIQHYFDRNHICNVDAPMGHRWYYDKVVNKLVKEIRAEMEEMLKDEAAFAQLLKEYVEQEKVSDEIMALIEKGEATQAAGREKMADEVIQFKMDKMFEERIMEDTIAIRGTTADGVALGHVPVPEDRFAHGVDCMNVFFNTFIRKDMAKGEQIWMFAQSEALRKEMFKQE